MDYCSRALRKVTVFWLFFAFWVYGSSVAYAQPPGGGMIEAEGQSIEGENSPFLPTGVNDLPATITFSGGTALVKGSEKPEHAEPYSSSSAGNYGCAYDSFDPGNGPGPGYVKCSGAINATVKLNLPADRMPPFIVIEQKVLVSWYGMSGTCEHGLTPTSGSENSGLHDVNEVKRQREGIKSVRLLTVIRNPHEQFSLAPVNPKVDASCPKDIDTVGLGPLPASAHGQVIYSVRVLLPVASGTNCSFSSPAPTNLKTMTWTVGGESVVTNFHYTTRYTNSVRYDSTHFADGTAVFSRGSGMLEGDYDEESGVHGPDKEWSHVDVAVVYNRYAVRSATEFEYGQNTAKAGEDPVLKFGLSIHGAVVSAIKGMNYALAGESIGYTRAELVSDARKATVQHISAHGDSFGVLSEDNKVMKPGIVSDAVNQRAYGIPPVNVVFASACNTSKNRFVSLASSYGITPNATNRVYAGFNAVVYIAGAQAAARVFWQGMQKGGTAGGQIDPAMDAYLNELERARQDPDLSPQLLQNSNTVALIMTGDANTKLHGLYNLPMKEVTDSTGQKRQEPLPPLTWLVALDSATRPVSTLPPTALQETEEGN